MNDHILTLAREYAPCYLYEYDVMRRQVETLRQAFPRYDLLYSIKANPFPPVVRALAGLGLGADAASAPEVLLSRRCGMAKADIFFSAAGKSDAALEAAWDEGEIIAASLVEVARIGTLCEAKGQRRAIGVRMNPGFGMGGTVAVLAQAGCTVHYLTVTNGDQGNKNRTASPQETARVRRAEAIAAGTHLGAKAFHFLDHGDGTLDDVLGLSAQIARVIREVRPDAIFAPDPWLAYESHLDHAVTGRAAANAFLMSGRAAIPGGGDTQPHAASAIGYYFTAQPNTVVDISAVFEKKFEAIALHDSQMDAQTLAMYRVYFGMKGKELAAGKNFALGEGLKVLSPLHAHCFVDAARI